MTTATASQHDAATPAPGEGPDSRRILAIVGGGLVPYRIHFHERLVREIPELRLATITTRHPDLEPWGLREAPGINTLNLDRAAAPARTMTALLARQWRIGTSLLRWVKSHPIAAVVLNGYNNVAHIRLWRHCVRRGIPVFICSDSNIRGETTNARVKAIKRLVLPRLVKGCTGILPFGSLGSDYFQQYGAKPEQIVFSPVEPDYELIRSLPAPFVQSTLERLGLMPDRKRIVFCARLTEVKRADLAIDAFANIAALRPQWDLVLVGDGPLRNWLHWRVPSHLRARVIWTGFVGDQRTVSAVYAGSHVMVLPSDYEPWALVVNEAAAAGMALVVSSAVGAGPELVADGINGHVFAPGDREGLTRALRDATDPARLVPMREASAKILEDWRRRADPVAGIRESLRRAGVLK